MNLWLNSVGYIVAAAMAFDGALNAISDPKQRAKAMALLMLTALVGVDAMSWYWVASDVALINRSASVIQPIVEYPIVLHFIDFICIVAAMLAIAQFKECQIRDDAPLTADDIQKLRWGLGAMATYAVGIVIYWILLASIVRGNPYHPYWVVLGQAWNLDVGPTRFAIETIALYAPIAVVSFLMMYFACKSESKRVTCRWIHNVVWCCNGKVWPSIACWLTIPIAIYASLGPTQWLLETRVGWPAWITYAFVGTTLFVLALGIVLVVFGVRQRMRTTRAGSTNSPRSSGPAIPDLRTE